MDQNPDMITEEELAKELDRLLRKKELRELGAQRNDLREQHIREQLVAQKSDNMNIPENIFIRPLHQDPAQHLERLAVVLMFCTRFSDLSPYQQNLYSRVFLKVPLFEMFERDFVERSCSEYGVDFGRVQLVVDELWKAKVFLTSSTLMRDLRMYTDEDLGSDRFRKAVGLPVRKSQTGSDDEREFQNAIQRNDQKLQERIEERTKQPVSPPSPKYSGKSVARSKFQGPPVGDRTPPPRKSRYMTITSGTAIHGGKNNVYNPSLLRLPKAAIGATPSLKNPQPITHGSGPQPRSWTASSSTRDTTNLRSSFSTSGVPGAGSLGGPTQSQPAGKDARAGFVFKDVSNDSQRPHNTNNNLSAAPLHTSPTASSAGFGQSQSTDSESRAGSGFGGFSTSNSRAESMNTLSSAVTPAMYRTGSSIVLGQSQSADNDARAGFGFRLSLTSSGRLDGMNNSPSPVTSDEYPVGDPMDIDTPLLLYRASKSLIRSPSSRKSAENSFKSGSGAKAKAGAASTSRKRRDSINSQSSVVASGIQDMRINHSRIHKRMRKSRRTSPSLQHIATDYEKLVIY